MNNLIIDWDRIVVPNTHNIKVTKMEVFGQTVLVLDNVLTKESFEEVSRLSDELPVSNYKSYHIPPQFIDARFQGVDTLTPLSNIVVKCVRQYLGVECDVGKSDTWAINYFKTIDQEPPFIGGTPHIDSIGQGFASLLYLNNQEIGGTAFYKTKAGVCKVQDPAQKLRNQYSRDYRLTQEDYLRNFEDMEVVKGVPNRMLIYSSDMYHGASHSEQQHVDTFRKTLVCFYSHLYDYLPN